MVQAAFTTLQVFRKHISMRDYGAGSEKPTWLYSGWGLSYVSEMMPSVGHVDDPSCNSVSVI